MTNQVENENEVSKDEVQKFALKIVAITGAEGAKETETLWTGRQVGKQPRKDLMLSRELPKLTDEMVTMLSRSGEFAAKIATIINDEFAAYVRRVKCQRLDIGSSIELMLPVAASDFAAMAVNMLSAPATRAKKLVSSTSIRAMLLSDIYKAAAKLVMGTKLDNWQRIGEKEMIPLAYATDAQVDTKRATVRDNVVIRMIEIAAIMPEDNEHRIVLEAAAELLSEVEVADLDNSI